MRERERDRKFVIDFLLILKEMSMNYKANNNVNDVDNDVDVDAAIAVVAVDDEQLSGFGLVWFALHWFYGNLYKRARVAYTSAVVC